MGQIYNVGDGVWQVWLFKVLFICVNKNMRTGKQVPIDLVFCLLAASGSEAHPLKLHCGFNK